MELDELDDLVEPWTKNRGFVLCKNVASEAARFFYVSAEYESYQVSLEINENDHIVVHTWSIDTLDDAELHSSWITDIDHLYATLSAALEQIEIWKKRDKISFH